MDSDPHGQRPRLSYLLPLACLFVSCLLISTTISVKIIAVGMLTLPAGIIIYPMVSTLGDVITEVYGFKNARRVIFTGLACLVLIHFVYLIAVALPPAAFWNQQESFAAILGYAPRIALAALCAYPVGEIVNSAVLSKLKAVRSNDHPSTRFFLSTLVGQGVDSLIFITIAFAGTIGLGQLLNLMFFSWLMKVLWETIALPISVAAANMIKRLEGGEVTDFHV